MGLQEIYSYTILTECEVKMTRYWLSSFDAFSSTETKSRSIKTYKKTEINIQPSWPNKREHKFHGWSRVFISFFVFISPNGREGRKWIDKKYIKKESSTVSTYNHMVHELITEVEWSHRGLEMQPQVQNWINQDNHSYRWTQMLH